MRMNAKQIIKKLDSLKADRGLWETHWQDLADYIIPRKNEIVVRNRTKGRKKGEYLFDNTAMVSAELLAAALHGILTNPSETFFDLTTGDPVLDNDVEMSEYLQALSRKMHDILNNSNFQTEVHELYLDLVCFGTSVMTIEEDDKSIVRFNVKNLANCYLDETSDGRVEEVYRTFKLTAKQIVQTFGDGVKDDEEAIKEKFGRHVAMAFKKGANDKFEIIHAVYREDVLSKKQMPFLSQYVLRKGEIMLREKNFRSFPFVTPRWTKVSEEIYGRSPGMSALPEAKTTNEMTKAVLKGAQKTVDPPLQGPDDGVVSPRAALPGSFSYYRAGSRDRIEPIFRDVRVDLGVELTRDRQNRIREAFFVNQLQLIENPNMTATEANIRREEQRRLLSPVLGRQQNEFLRPLIARTLDIMLRKGLVDEPPQEIPAGLIIQYSSPIARAQKVDQGQNLNRAFAASLPFFEQSPESFDNVDPDAAIKFNWKIYGAPMETLRRPQQIDAIREARAEAQQAAIERQNQMDETEQVSKLGKAVPQQGA